MKYSYVSVTLVGAIFYSQNVRADVNLLGSQRNIYSSSVTYYSTTDNRQYVYIDTKPVADAIKELTAATRSNALTPEMKTDMKLTYDLGTYGSMIGVDIDSAESAKLVETAGMATFKQVIEDRILNLRVNGVILANFARALMKEEPVTEADLRNEQEMIRLGKFFKEKVNLPLFYRLLDLSRRMESNSPNAESWAARMKSSLPSIEAEYYFDQPLLNTSGAKSLNEDPSSAYFLFALLRQAEKDGMNFKNLGYQNTVKDPQKPEMNALLKSGRVFHKTLVASLNNDREAFPGVAKRIQGLREIQMINMEAFRNAMKDFEKMEGTCKSLKSYVGELDPLPTDAGPRNDSVVDPSVVAQRRWILGKETIQRMKDEKNRLDREIQMLNAAWWLNQNGKKTLAANQRVSSSVASEIKEREEALNGLKHSYFGLCADRHARALIQSNIVEHIDPIFESASANFSESSGRRVADFVQEWSKFSKTINLERCLTPYYPHAPGDFIPLGAHRDAAEHWNFYRRYGDENFVIKLNKAGGLIEPNAFTPEGLNDLIQLCGFIDRAKKLYGPSISEIQAIQESEKDLLNSPERAEFIKSLSKGQAEFRDLRGSF